MSSLDLHKIYSPITALPFERTEAYMEVAPRSELRPYIRCFWGSGRPYIKSPDSGIYNRVITPDTCMDIIFDIDYTNNTIQSCFCGIDDRSFAVNTKNNVSALVSTFAIRFYPWSVILFSEDSISGVKNGFFDVGQHFPKLKKAIETMLFEVVNIGDRIKITEKYLLENIHTARINAAVMTAADRMLRCKGNIKVTDLAKEADVGVRQLERLFVEYMGISPKQISSLIRYQYLWNEALYNKNFDILDAVHTYGYTDQSHLIKEFKKYHTMTINEARIKALGNVAFLQDNSSLYVYNR